MRKLNIGAPLLFKLWDRRIATAWQHYTFVFIFLTVGTAIRLAYIVPLTSPPIIVEPYIDDGYYYLEIARNFAREGRFTFDTIHHTNGFHPLWQLLLIVLASISTDQIILLRLAMLFSTLLFLTTAVILYRLVFRYAGRPAALAAVVLWTMTPGLIRWQNQGMENTVFVPLLLGAVASIDCYGHQPTNRRLALQLGTILGLLMWSRSDSVIFVGIALIGIALHLVRSDHPMGLTSKPYMLVTLLVVIWGGAYLVFNHLAAGSFLSVSSQVKIGDSLATAWSLSFFLTALQTHVAMLWALFASLGGFSWWGSLNLRIFPFQVAVVMLTTAASVFWVSHCFGHKQARRRQPFNHLGLQILMIYTALHSFLLISFLGNILTFTPWYIVPQVVLILLLGPLLLLPAELGPWLTTRWISGTKYFRTVIKAIATIPPLARWQKNVLYMLTLASFVLLPCVYALFVQLSTTYSELVRMDRLSPRYELANWLNTHVEPKATIAMFDAGMVGYFAIPNIINMDGLVNSPDYLQVRRARNFAEYVVKNQVNYIILYYYYPVSAQPEYWNPTGLERVCHKLLYTNKHPALWLEGVDNYFQVVALQYQDRCNAGWVKGFPKAAIPVSIAANHEKSIPSFHPFSSGTPW